MVPGEYYEYYCLTISSSVLWLKRRESGIVSRGTHARGLS